MPFPNGSTQAFQGMGHVRHGFTVVFFVFAFVFIVLFAFLVVFVMMLLQGLGQQDQPIGADQLMRPFGTGDTQIGYG